ncbi:MAG: M56 family metallopeptidase [Terracidiphilus sp.]|jgi:uncharacterized protein (TIGR03435 family)
MTILGFWGENWTAALVNHLWQSTFMVGITWALALALRKNPARARYWVWMAASSKFLFPFSLLIAAGEWLRSLIATPIVAKPALANVMEQIAQPFPQVQIFDPAQSPASAHRANLLPLVLLTIWACGALAVVLRFGWGWLQAYAAKRAAHPIVLEADVPALSSPSLIEPGIFGILRPALLLPEGILNRLTPQQLGAIVAHEMCHVRRRDNLTFTLHMFVEALFWFHPAVWWIGARLIEERERACDEAVVQAGGEAQTYAEGILSVCKFYVEPPLACVSAVTGSDLEMRIARIMSGRAVQKLNLMKRALLGALALIILTAPITLGLSHATGVSVQSDSQHTGGSAGAAGATGSRPSFEVVTVKPDLSGSGYWRNTADGFSAIAHVNTLIQSAYWLTDEQVIGLPGWARTDSFAVEGKMDANTASALDRLSPLQHARQVQLMMQSMLADRFALRAHSSTRTLPVYELRIAKSGCKMKKSPVDAGGAAEFSNGKIEARSTSITMLALNLSSTLGQVVVDKTGLQGSYDFTLEWAPEGADPSDPRPSIFTAFEEQLGLKLVEAKGPIEVLIVDHVEKPSPN